MGALRGLSDNQIAQRAASINKALEGVGAPYFAICSTQKIKGGRLKEAIVWRKRGFSCLPGYDNIVRAGEKDVTRWINKNGGSYTGLLSEPAAEAKKIKSKIDKKRADDEQRENQKRAKEEARRAKKESSRERAAARKASTKQSAADRKAALAEKRAQAKAAAEAKKAERKASGAKAKTGSKKMHSVAKTVTDKLPPNFSVMRSQGGYVLIFKDQQQEQHIRPRIFATEQKAVDMANRIYSRLWKNAKAQEAQVKEIEKATAAIERAAGSNDVKVVEKAVEKVEKAVENIEKIEKIETKAAAAYDPDTDPAVAASIAEVMRALTEKINKAN